MYCINISSIIADVDADVVCVGGYVIGSFGL
jgi:hypothetical protein